MSVDEVMMSNNSLRVVHNSTQMIKLMNKSLLDTQAIDQGNLNLNLESSSPEDLIKQLLAFMNLLVEQRGITVNVKIDDSEMPFPKQMVLDALRF